MTAGIAILEINDQAITLTTQQGRYASPGYALFEGQWLALGEEAEQQARLQPRAANNQFWQQLSLEPLPNASDKIQHTADLVYHQLQTLFRELTDHRVILALPGYFSDEQISLLLGICDSLQQPIIGIVDMALIACADQPAGDYWHLDMHLHQCLLSHIKIANGRVDKTQNIVIPGSGKAQFNDAWVRAISDEFIQQTRFNPRHKAEHEQILYNQLEPWWHSLRAGDSQVQVAENSVSLSFNTLIQASKRALEPLLTTLDDCLSSTTQPGLLLSHNAQCLQHIHRSFSHWQLLAEDCIAEQCQHLLPQLLPQLSGVDGTSENSDGSMVFIDHLVSTHLEPTTQSSQSAAHNTSLAAPSISLPSPKNPTPRATHLLIGSVAYSLQNAWLSAKQPAIEQQPSSSPLCQLRQTGQQYEAIPLSEDCALNGARLTQPSPIKPGDQLGNSKVSYTVIQVQ